MFVKITDLTERKYTSIAMLTYSISCGNFQGKIIQNLSVFFPGVMQCSLVLQEGGCHENKIRNFKTG